MAWPALVVTEVDSLVIGGALSVRALGIYSPGANFANQLSSVASNGLGPAGVHLANVYGREGEEGTFREFKRLQRMWVVAVTGWTMVAMAAAYFGILAWLGPGSACLAGSASCSSPVPRSRSLPPSSAVTSIAVGKAGALARYGVVSMVVNIVLTVPMVLAGFPRRRGCHCHRSIGRGRLRAARRPPYCAARPSQPSALRATAARDGRRRRSPLALRSSSGPTCPLEPSGCLEPACLRWLAWSCSGCSCSGREGRSECWPNPAQPCGNCAIGDLVGGACRGGRGAGRLPSQARRRELPAIPEVQSP